ncbi:MAG: IniB N-terminal domain-containing protein [Paenarthrobacter sp.]
MPTLAQQLVQFLMSLFNDPDAAEDFVRDPEAALAAAGLRDVSSADVDAVRPVVLDYAPINARSSFDREYNTGGNQGSTGGGAGWGGHDDDDDHGHGGGGGGGWGGGDDHDDHAHAVQQLVHVVNNYSYTTTIDDRDTITDQSVNQNIWADGDVTQLFNQDAVIASGDGAIAAGDDVKDSGNTTTTTTTTNTDDHSTDNSVTIRETGPGDVEVGNTDIEVKDSFNDNSDNSVTKDSYNTDVDVDVDIEDSFNEDNSSHTDNSHTNIHNTDSFNKDSYNTENELEVGDVDVEYTNIENSTIIKDNEVELEYTNDHSTNVELEDVQVNYDSTVIQDNELEIDNSKEIDVEDVQVNYDSTVIQDNEVDVEYNDIDHSNVIAKNDVEID